MRRLVAGSGDAAEMPTRQEALGLLAAAAREGNVAAMVALARELRVAYEPDPVPGVEIEHDDELAAFREHHAKVEARR